MIYLLIEDIVANSIIENYKLKEEKKVLMTDAKTYGQEVAKNLTKKGYYTRLKLNPLLTQNFEERYSNYFKKYYEKDDYGYQLTSEKEINDIILAFRSSLSQEVTDSLTDSEVIKNSLSKTLKRENGTKK